MPRRDRMTLYSDAVPITQAHDGVERRNLIGAGSSLVVPAHMRITDVELAPGSVAEEEAAEGGCTLTRCCFCCKVRPGSPPPPEQPALVSLPADRCIRRLSPAGLSSDPQRARLRPFARPSVRVT